MAGQVQRNIAFSYANRLTNLVGVIVLVPLYTRFLGHRLYGEWLVITSIITYLTLTGLGIDQILANRIAELTVTGRQSESGALISTAFFAYSVIALMLVVGFALFSGWICTLLVHDRASALALATVGSLCALSVPLNANIMMLRGLGRVDREQALGLKTNLVRTSAVVAALLLGFKLLPLALIQGGTAIGLGLSALVSSRRLSDGALPRLGQFSFPTLRALLAPGLGFLVLQTAGIVGFGIDNLVIGYALGPEAVTRYAVPFSLLMAASALVSTASVALLPTITVTYARARNGALATGSIVAMRLALAYGGVGAIVFWIAGPWLLRFWAGAGIFPGERTFALQLGLFLLQVLIAPPFAILVATTHHYGTALMHVVESALNLVLSLWWVRVFGLSGVIAGTVVARLVTTAWYIPFQALVTLDLSPGRAARAVGPCAGLVLLTFGAVVMLWPSSERVPIATAAPAAILGSLSFLLVFAWLGFNREERQSLAVRLSALCRRGQMA